MGQLVALDARVVAPAGYDREAGAESVPPRTPLPKRARAPSPNACVLAFVFLLFGDTLLLLAASASIRRRSSAKESTLGVLSTGSHSGSDANCELFPRGTWMCFTITPILLSGSRAIIWPVGRIFT